MKRRPNSGAEAGLRSRRWRIGNRLHVLCLHPYAAVSRRAAVAAPRLCPVAGAGQARQGKRQHFSSTFQRAAGRFGLCAGEPQGESAAEHAGGNGRACAGAAPSNRSSTDGKLDRQLNRKLDACRAIRAAQLDDFARRQRPGERGEQSPGELVGLVRAKAGGEARAGNQQAHLARCAAGSLRRAAGACARPRAAHCSRLPTVRLPALEPREPVESRRTRRANGLHRRRRRRPARDRHWGSGRTAAAG